MEGRGLERGRVLVVEPWGGTRTWADVLAAGGWDVARTGPHNAARHRLGAGATFDGVLIDAGLPDDQVSGLVTRLNGREPSPTIVVLADASNLTLVVELMGRVDAIIPKPVGDDDLLKLMAKAIESSPWGCLNSFARLHQLSPTEAKLLRLALLGETNVSAAETLQCKMSSLQTFWKRIRTKTKCHSQRDVMAKLWHHTYRRASRQVSGVPEAAPRPRLRGSA